MFGKLQLVAALAATVALGGLSIWGFSLRAEKAQLSATVGLRDATIVATNQQNQDLSKALQAKDAELQLEKNNHAAADTATANAKRTAASLAASLADIKRKINDATSSDDGPAAPVLGTAVDGLRRYSENLKSLRSRHNQGAGVSGAAPAASAPADPWPGLKYPFKQSEFAAACFQLGDALADAAAQLAGLDDYQIAFNANIHQAQGTADAAAASGAK